MDYEFFFGMLLSKVDQEIPEFMLYLLEMKYKNLFEKNEYPSATQEGHKRFCNKELPLEENIKKEFERVTQDFADSLLKEETNFMLHLLGNSFEGLVETITKNQTAVGLFIQNCYFKT